MQAYAKGDLDGDFDHDLVDFIAFRVAYENANGLGAFARMLSGVPEPNTFSMLSIGPVLLLTGRRASRDRSLDR